MDTEVNVDMFFAAVGERRSDRNVADEEVKEQFFVDQREWWRGLVGDKTEALMGKDAGFASTKNTQIARNK